MVNNGVQVLPYVPGFGEKLADALSQAGANVGQGLLQRSQNRQTRSILQQIAPTQPGFAQIQQESNMDPQRGNLSDMQLVQFTGHPNKQVAEASKAELQRRSSLQNQDFVIRKENLKANEPILKDISDNQKTLELEDARFQRLENLFSDPSKFPSALTAAMFSKEGQINAIGSALLTPEAQESVKLITDNISGAKDTFGARVTNFDLQTYLKRLPSLLNSPEGRERVLRDLRIINKINQVHNNGIMEVFEEKGGSDKLSFSSAERLFKKKYGKQLDELKKEFVNPSDSKFDALPSPEKYLGRKVKNEKTGEVFISDGKQWKLESGAE